MASAERDILTTAQTAKILGVSTRTAQLLIESGSLPSWKTPGGHRRVYRADVLKIVSGGDPAPTPVRRNPSARVVVIGSGDRLPAYRQLFSGTAEFTVELFSDVLAALVAVGSMCPFAIVVDMEAAGAERSPLLRSLARNPAVAGSHLLAVGQAAGAPDDLARITLAHDVAAARDALLAFVTSEAEPPTEEVEHGVPVALNEGDRLLALGRSGLLDSEPEDAFDRLTWLASQMLRTPIALMTLLTPSRQWFKSRVGMDLAETPRSWAFCNHTIMQRDVFAVEDLSQDPRFADNPAVAGERGFRFYAGAPVIDEDGFVVGSLCVIDHTPRRIDERDSRAIATLAQIASDELRLRNMDRRSAGESVNLAGVAGASVDPGDGHAVHPV
jgi:excisionase family DNA binding protein